MNTSEVLLHNRRTYEDKEEFAVCLKCLVSCQCDSMGGELTRLCSLKMLLAAVWLSVLKVRLRWGWASDYSVHMGAMAWGEVRGGGQWWDSEPIHREGKEQLGFSYRSGIRRWIKTFGSNCKGKHHTTPNSGQLLPRSVIIVPYRIRTTIHSLDFSTWYMPGIREQHGPAF